MNAADAVVEVEIPPDALRAGEKAAWDALFRRWDKPVRAYLYRLSGDMCEADELASETFVRAWKARASITGGKISTWLFTIATNLHRNRRRWWRRRLKWLVGMEEDFPEARDPAPAPDDAAMRDESAARVRDAVLALPDELREPLVLAVYEDKSHAEIGAILGLTVKAVERRVSRARDRLRSKLG
jgi:RNA polymerase sigma factor (sigma-70 family)